MPASLAPKVLNRKYAIAGGLPTFVNSNELH